MVEIGKESQKSRHDRTDLQKSPVRGGGFLRAPAGAPSFALLLLAHQIKLYFFDLLCILTSFSLVSKIIDPTPPEQARQTNVHLRPRQMHS